MSPRILHLCTRYRSGGSEQRVRDLVAAVDGDHRLVLGGQSDAERAGRDFPEHEIEVWPQLRRAVNPIHDVPAMSRLVDDLRRRPADLLVTHQSKSGLIGRAAGRWTGTPVIHSLSMANTGPGYPTSGRILFAGVERLAAPWADRYLVVGQDLAWRVQANGSAARSGAGRALGGPVPRNRPVAPATTPSPCRRVRVDGSGRPTMARLGRKPRSPQESDAAPAS